jgi:hypothetical protein
MPRMKRLLATLALAAVLAVPAQAQKQPDPKAVQEIFDCLAVGLPKDWKKAWVVVTELADTGKERRFESQSFYADSSGAMAGKPLATCGAQIVAKGVIALTADLPAEQRRWKEARLTYTSEGRFDIYYDYGK